MPEFNVLKPFRDKQTKARYTPGDTFILDDLDRINKAVSRGLIEAKEKQADVSDYHLGGGWYELPSGQRVQGKAAAEEALKAGE